MGLAPCGVPFFNTFSTSVLHATAACNFSTPQRQKMVRACGVLCILTCKCASGYSGVQFFHIPTSKCGPELVCFVHLDLANVLLAPAACNFSTSKLQKVARTWCVLYILTCKCASRYSMQFFLSPVNSYFRTRRFTEVTFRPSRPTNHWKHTAFRDFSNISRLWIFFLSALLFQLSILSEVRLLSFLRQSQNKSKFAEKPYAQHAPKLARSVRKWLHQQVKGMSHLRQKIDEKE